MRYRSKYFWIPPLALSLFVLVLFFPEAPWAGRVHHLLKRIGVRAEIKLAGWRGREPRLISIAGQLNAPGLQVQALDSKSGWAALAGPDGKFVLSDVMWYPGATYELVISADESRGRLIQVRAPETFPETGVLSIGGLDLSRATEVELDSLPGINSITVEKLDSENRDYYKALFDELTAGYQSDDQKISALNAFVASKRNLDETRELSSPRRVLERGSEFCGYLSTALETLVAIGGYKTRAVQMKDNNDPPGTHVAVEVFYDGAWHLYDPTYGVTFLNKDRQIASYKDVRLDTSLISEDLFQSVRRKIRRRVVEQIQRMYATGYYHLYEFGDR
jgi:hypothetical protein